MRAFCRYNNHSMYRYNNRAFGCEQMKPGRWFLPFTTETPIPNSSLIYENGHVLTAMCLYPESDFTLYSSNRNHTPITYHALVSTRTTPDNTKVYYAYKYGRVIDQYTEIGQGIDLVNMCITRYPVEKNGEGGCEYIQQSKDDDIYPTWFSSINSYYDPYNTFLFNNNCEVFCNSSATHIDIRYPSRIDPNEYTSFHCKSTGVNVNGADSYANYVFSFMGDNGTDHYTYNIMNGEFIKNGEVIENILPDKKATEMTFYNSRGNNINRQLESYPNNDIGFDCEEVEIISVDCHIGYDAEGNKYILDSNVYKPGIYSCKTFNLIKDLYGWYYIGVYMYSYGWSYIANYYTGIYMNDDWELYDPNISHYDFGYVKDKYDLDGQPIYPYHPGYAPDFNDNLFGDHGLRHIDFQLGQDWYGDPISTYGQLSTGRQFKFVFNKEVILDGISNNSY